MTKKVQVFHYRELSAALLCASSLWLKFPRSLDSYQDQDKSMLASAAVEVCFSDLVGVTFSGFTRVQKKSHTSCWSVTAVCWTPYKNI